MISFKKMIINKMKINFEEIDKQLEKLYNE